MTYEVIDAIRYPDKILKKYNKIFYQKNTRRGKIEVCTEKKEKVIKIITVYWV